MDKETTSYKKNEITGVILIGLAALCAASVCFGVDSAFGSVVSEFVFGVGGILGYVAPILLGAVGVLVIMARKRRVNPGKLLCILLLALLVFSMIHLGVVQSITLPGETYGRFLTDSYAIGAADRSGGGVLGGLLTYWTYTYLGLAGSWIVCIVGVAACLLAITNLSVRKLSEDIGSAVKSGYSTVKASYEEFRAAEKEEQIQYMQSVEQNGGARRTRRNSNPFDLQIQDEGMKKRMTQKKRSRKSEEPTLIFQEKTPKPSKKLIDLSTKRRARRKRHEHELTLDIGDPKARRASAEAGAGTYIEDICVDTAPETRTQRRRVGAELDISAAQPRTRHVRSASVFPEIEFDSFPDNDCCSEGQVPRIPDGVSASRINTAPDDALSRENVPELPLTSESGGSGDFSESDDMDTKREYHVETEQNRAGTAAALAADTGSRSYSPAAGTEHRLPPLDLLDAPAERNEADEAELQRNAALLDKTLESFRIKAEVVNILRGPVVTRYELEPASGVRVSSIAGLADDIARNLAASSIRIEAPVPGKTVVGIEIPNTHRDTVGLRELLEDPKYGKTTSAITFALGRDITGSPVYADIAKMPHLLVAGQTGSGKSVCINSLIVSILYRATADDVKMLMIDPKQVELSDYNPIPHLIAPVVTDPKKAAMALGWAVTEMDQRYKSFSERHAKDLKGYNKLLEADGEKKLPQIVVIVDELADLMMTAGKEIEASICRIAQLGRACGIHLVLATQRPTKDVITGLIKSNVPGRIAFSVQSGMDSRIILDATGAEKLLGRGDMLFSATGQFSPERIQGCNVTGEEIARVVDYIKVDKNTDEAVLDFNQDTAEEGIFSDDPELDPFFAEAGRLAIENETVSTSFLQRRLRIGYGRAARIVDQLCDRGIVSGPNGSKAREVLVSLDEFERQYGNK